VLLVPGLTFLILNRSDRIEDRPEARGVHLGPRDGCEQAEGPDTGGRLAVIAMRHK